MRLVKIGFVALLAFSFGSAWAQTPRPAPAPPTPRQSVQPIPPVAPIPAPGARTWNRYTGADQVLLRDVAAFVRIIPENRTDVAVAVINRGPLRAPEARVSRGRLVLDGKLRRQIRSCHVEGAEGFEVETARNGRLSGAQLPVIELRVPQAVVVSSNGAVRLHVGPAQSARVRLDGCGDADFVRVADEAEISVAGASDVRLYEAGEATIALAGAGDVTVGHIRSGLTVSLAGSGDFIAARADGPTNIALQGTGDVLVRDGRATTLSIVIAGEGDVTHNGQAQRLDAVIVGGGDVRVRRVDGQVTRRVIGSGDVLVGR